MDTKVSEVTRTLKLLNALSMMTNESAFLPKGMQNLGTKHRHRHLDREDNFRPTP